MSAGENVIPTLLVPDCFMLNKITRNMIETMTVVSSVKLDISSCRPLTTDMIDIAGVSMPSPITMEVPMRNKSSSRVFNFVLLKAFFDS